MLKKEMSDVLHDILARSQCSFVDRTENRAAFEGAQMLFGDA